MENTTDKAMEGRYVRILELMELAKHSENPWIRLDAAKLLMDYGGRKPDDRLIIRYE